MLRILHEPIGSVTGARGLRLPHDFTLRHTSRLEHGTRFTILISKGDRVDLRIRLIRRNNNRRILLRTERDGRNHRRHTQNTPVMEEEIIIKTLRIRNTPVLKEHILDQEEVLSRKDRRRILQLKGLIRDRNDMRRGLCVDAVESGCEGRNIDVRLELRSRDDHQVLGAGERMHTILIVRRSGVAHLIGHNTESLKSTIRRILIRNQSIHVRNLDPVETPLGLILTEK